MDTMREFYIARLSKTNWFLDGQKTFNQKLFLKLVCALIHLINVVWIMYEALGSSKEEF